MIHTISGDTTHIAAPMLPAVRDIVIPDTQPGQTVRLSVGFTAPMMPGAYVSYWRSYFEDGSLCYPDARGLVCRIQVQSVVSNVIAL